jgi:hypothetical protein
MVAIKRTPGRSGLQNYFERVAAMLRGENFPSEDLGR